MHTSDDILPPSARYSDVPDHPGSVFKVWNTVPVTAVYAEVERSLPKDSVRGFHVEGSDRANLRALTSPFRALEIKSL